MLERQDILIRRNKIERVCEKLAVPFGARETDPRNATVLPELIDTHTHLIQNELPPTNKSSE